MATNLDVVNDCLATLGEAPLSTLSEPHEFKPAATRLLSRMNKEVQTIGWWCNTETMTLNPAPTTGHLVLPGDTLKWESGVRSQDTFGLGQHKPWFVQRGLRLYDTRKRMYESEESVVGIIVREIPFEELPQVLNDYIAATTVLRFQSNFDGDTQRRGELTQHMNMTRAMARAEDIRQNKFNAILTNVSLSRIQSLTRNSRRYL